MYNDFKNFSTKHIGISGMQLHDWEKTQKTIYSNGGVSNSMTPMILEEREMRVTAIDVFSRLMRDRILWIAGPVNDYMGNVVQAQLLYLSSVSDEDITMYINTPGGGVTAGLSMIDTMELCKPDIKTINSGMAASMGSVLLGAGTKGKRLMLPSARVMLHQVSSGMEGNVQDIEISFRESLKYNELLFKKLGEYCGKDADIIKKDSTRDLWLNSEEALEYGIIDEIITKKVK